MLRAYVHVIAGKNRKWPGPIGYLCLHISDP